jgi:hypothetical protein
MKIKIGDSGVHKNPKVGKGWSLWIENGIWYKARSVNKKKYGPHTYMINYNNPHECPCGCYMGGYSSSGPVDPFGPCPSNPKVNKTRG